jgi:hypothetical protein
MRRREFLKGLGVAPFALSLSSDPSAAGAATTPKLPDWAPRPGTVAAINLNTLSDVDPCPRRNCSYSGVLGQAGVLAAWNSGAYAPEYSTHGGYVVRGGGDADYWGNETYAFDLDTRLWKRITQPSEVEAGRGVISDPLECLHADGRLGSPHSYDAYVYRPPALGGGPKGSLFIAQTTFVKNSHTSSRAWTIDLATGSEERFTLNRPALPSSHLPTCCLDPVRQRVWLRRWAMANAVWYTDLAPSGASYRVWSRVSVPASNCAGYPVSLHYPVHDLWLIADNRGSAAGPFVLHAYRLANLALPRVTLEVHGDLTLADVGIGFAFVPESNAFFLRSSNAADPQKVWKLTPPSGNPLAEPWTLKEIRMAGASVAEGTHRGYYKRFCYASKIRCLIWTSSRTGAVYAYRPAEV